MILQSAGDICLASSQSCSCSAVMLALNSPGEVFPGAPATAAGGFLGPYECYNYLAAAV